MPLLPCGCSCCAASAEIFPPCQISGKTKETTPAAAAATITRPTLAFTTRISPSNEPDLFGRRRDRIAGRRMFLATFAPALDQRVEHRHADQAEHRRRQHAAEDGGADRLPARR